jgi:hypothetical protein
MRLDRVWLIIRSGSQAAQAQASAASGQALRFLETILLTLPVRWPALPMRQPFTFEATEARK